MLNCLFVIVTFKQDLQNHEDRVTEVNTLAEQLIEDEHPEEATIRQRQSVSFTFSIDIWYNLFLFICVGILLELVDYFISL